MNLLEVSCFFLISWLILSLILFATNVPSIFSATISNRVVEKSLEFVCGGLAEAQSNFNLPFPQRKAAALKNVEEAKLAVVLFFFSGKKRGVKCERGALANGVRGVCGSADACFWVRGCCVWICVMPFFPFSFDVESDKEKDLCVK